MDKLLYQFIENLSAGDLWYGFLMLGVFYILKKEPFKVFTHFSEKKTKDLSQAQALLESGKLSKDADNLLQEHIEQELFVKYYGIRAGKEMRSALLKFYNKNQAEIGWHDLRRAYSSIYLDGTKVKVNIKWWEHPMRWLVTAISWSIGAYAIFVLIVAAVARTENQLHFFGLSIMAIFLLVLALFFSSLNWPYHSARKVLAGQN
ncbi:hypothetical protein [Denitrificimonas caeni]|uniref:hypothetical protein n=1 Tax=Denitrificimonas caeni TaxID=521720 RepID=UPI0003B56422|nr:hypothetical protein [Denitrificimonas caeni]